jgi:hypothetical protein
MPLSEKQVPPKKSPVDRGLVKLPNDFEAAVKALLKTPPPPAGHPATRKKSAMVKEAKKR